MGPTCHPRHPCVSHGAGIGLATARRIGLGLIRHLKFRAAVDATSLTTTRRFTRVTGVRSSKLRQFLRPDPMCDAPAGSTVLESTTASRFSQMEHRADQSLEAGSPELGLLLFAVIAVLIYFVY